MDDDLKRVVEQAIREQSHAVYEGILKDLVGQALNVMEATVLEIPTASEWDRLRRALCELAAVTYPLRRWGEGRRQYIDCPLCRRLAEEKEASGGGT